MTADSRTRVRWLTVAMIALASVGCREKAVDPTPPTVVLIDVSTDRPVEHLAVNDYPATNPATGNATLMPAMYCSICGAWRAVPAPDQINRVPQATQCSGCRGQLSPDGPMPLGRTDRE